jgi:adenylate cyclase
VKVLVADDNADNRQLLEDILRGQGYQPLIARDGEEALRIAREAIPDLLILDINMPGLTGFDVCAELKADTMTQPIPILMLTALTDVENRVKGLGLGADDYVTKPYSPRELVARIDARLRSKSNTDELRATQELIRQTFERFVPSKVVHRLLEDPGQIRLGGQLQEITIVFADLEGFTSVAERAAPDMLISVLNQYHALMVRHVKTQEGTIDKFMGDGIMALFNTPLPQADHALRAVRTAIAIRDALPEFHSGIDPQFRLNINFGIHTGEAIVGNVGCDELMNFTAIGDAVNLTSRLEDISKGGQILISESTHRIVRDYVQAEKLGPKMVKGRETPVTVYDVRGFMA